MLRNIFTLSAVNSAGQSANSAEVSATQAAPTQIPAVPIGVVAAAGNAQVTLTWTASNGAGSYEVNAGRVAVDLYADSHAYSGSR